jgi:putative sigma-54 modulation protein
MDITISGHNLDITDHMRDYIEKKFVRLERHLPGVLEARVDLSVENTRSADSRQIAQVTVRTERGTILRAEERAADMFAAIDAVMDKVSHQVEHYKSKRAHRRRGAARAAGQAAAVPQLEALEEFGDEDEEEVGTAEIVRRKRFIVQPMSEEEAVEQLELLGHDFFLFYNPDVAQINVVYRRKGQGYGLLQPDLG